MSVSDPLLRELKGCVVKWVQASGSREITDDNEELQPFCQTLEKIFQKGLLQTSHLGYTKISESWNWLERMAKQNNGTPYSFTSSINAVKSSQKIVTPIGRLRLLIRTCLVNRCLHIPVEFLVRKRQLNNWCIYDENNSILGNEILGEIFLSVLLQCSRLQFKLDLSNAAFLDDTWLLPYYTKLEFVPCKMLGICVCFVNAKGVVVGIKSDSVAAEDDKIEVGDILDELNSNHITSNRRGRLAAIMRKGSGQPIVVNVIKAYFPETGELYPPVISLLRQAQLDPEEIHLHCNGKMKHTNGKLCDQLKKLSPAIRPGFDALYMGNISTGKRGDVKQIERAVKEIVFNSKSKLHQPVLFEIQEIGVKVTDKDAGKVLLKHSYMEISSCGRTLSAPYHFAYIAGEANCNIAKNFTCYIFQTGNEEHIQTILQSIGQGFQRTHYAV